MMRYTLWGAFVLFSATNAATVSRDARCGQNYGTTCLNSKYGSCCSQNGWCGSTNDYCGTGCQNEFGTCNKKPSSSPAPSSTLRASSTPTRSQSPSATQPISQNARCGEGFGKQTCLGSQWGGCCSQYNYCGSTFDYCNPQSCQAKYGRCDTVSSSSRSSTQLSTATTRPTSQSTSKPLSSSSSSVLSSSASSTRLTTATSQTLTPSSSKISSSVSNTSPTLIQSSSSSSSVIVSSSAISSSVVSSSSQVSTAVVSSTPTPISSSILSSTPSSTLSSVVTPTPTPLRPQLVPNPGFEDGFAPWRDQGSDGSDSDITGVTSGDSHSGTNAFRAGGSARGWVVDIAQTLAFVPNRAYLLEIWAKSSTAGCTVSYSLLGKAGSFVLTTSYTRATLLVSADDVTPEVIAQSGGLLVVEMLCGRNFGSLYSVYVDDVTITAQ